MRQKPLTKRRLHALCALYGPITMDEQGGWDTGVYFVFRGRAREGALRGLDRIVEGRIAGAHGFCSESLQRVRRPFAASESVEMFFERVSRRRGQLERWLDEIERAKPGQNYD